MFVRAKLTAVGIATLMSCRPKRETSVTWQPDVVPNCADKVFKITTVIDIPVAQSQQSLLCCLLSWSSSVTACPQHVEAFSTMPQAAVMLQRALSDKVWSASAYITPGLSLDDVALAFIWTRQCAISTAARFAGCLWSAIWRTLRWLLSVWTTPGHFIRRSVQRQRMSPLDRTECCV